MMSSRIEDILNASLSGAPYTAQPQSRAESLLLQLKEKIDLGGASASDIQTAVTAYMDLHPELIGGDIDEDELNTWLGGN